MSRYNPQPTNTDSFRVGFNYINPSPVGRQGGRISIQFDDGYDDTFLNAKPILDKYGFKASVWMISDNIAYDGGTPLSKYMTAAQLIQLEDEGWEIGSHTKTHAHMTQITEAQMEDEFYLSKQALLTAGLRFIDSFAYPYGEYNATTLAIGNKYYSRQRITSAPVRNTMMTAGEVAPGGYGGDTQTRQGLLYLKQLCLNSVINNEDVSIYFHHISDAGGTATPIAIFRELIEYIHRIGGKVVPLRAMTLPYNLLSMVDVKFDTFDGWETANGVLDTDFSYAIDNTVSYSKPSSLRLTGLAAIGTKSIEVRGKNLFGAGVWSRRKVRLSVRYKIDTALVKNFSSAGFLIGLRFYKDYLIGTQVGAEARAVAVSAVSTGWQSLTLEAIVPAGAVLAVPNVKIEGAQGTVWVDDVLLTYPEWGTVV